MMVHNSDLEGSSDKYDCLIIDDQSNGTAITEFGRRPIEHLMHRNHSECDELTIVYFSNLRKENWTDIMMLESGVPVDIIDESRPI
ncbi:unnamed protein product [Rotaria magnacalcarata]|uniref:Uncharacterized protein n=1 Tax=Rotaria magnacalcarata TaxID=392030 RepID=A0A8S3GR67_9BILA|nr:unnamed protein product [Rotaria magnacalcarata]CAF5221477.1 unnamed protein product [Rotaria magnacalcarata]